jgi:hypothetical protein
MNSNVSHKFNAIYELEFLKLLLPNYYKNDILNRAIDTTIDKIKQDPTLNKKIYQNIQTFKKDYNQIKTNALNALKQGNWIDKKNGEINTYNLLKRFQNNKKEVKRLENILKQKKDFFITKIGSQSRRSSNNKRVSVKKRGGTNDLTDAVLGLLLEGQDPSTRINISETSEIDFNDELNSVLRNILDNNHNPVDIENLFNQLDNTPSNNRSALLAPPLPELPPLLLPERQSSIRQLTGNTSSRRTVRRNPTPTGTPRETPRRTIRRRIPSDSSFQTQRSQANILNNDIVLEDVESIPDLDTYREQDTYRDDNLYEEYGHNPRNVTPFGFHDQPGTRPSNNNIYGIYDDVATDRQQDQPGAYPRAQVMDPEELRRIQATGQARRKEENEMRQAIANALLESLGLPLYDQAVDFNGYPPTVAYYDENRAKPYTHEDNEDEGLLEQPNEQHIEEFKETFRNLIREVLDKKCKFVALIMPRLIFVGLISLTTATVVTGGLGLIFTAPLGIFLLVGFAGLGISGSGYLFKDSIRHKYEKCIRDYNTQLGDTDDSMQAFLNNNNNKNIKKAVIKLFNKIQKNNTLVEEILYDNIPIIGRVRRPRMGWFHPRNVARNVTRSIQKIRNRIPGIRRNTARNNAARVIPINDIQP